MLAAHPAVMVLGPRACGKTTTAARTAASEVRLSSERVATAVRADPGSALEGLATPVLIDEWQLVPDVLAAVKERVDGDARRGQFVLTGSARGDLDTPQWPGTGRLVRLSMFGLFERELERRIDGVRWLTRVLAGDDFASHRSTDKVRDYLERALRSGFPEPALRLTGPHRQRWLASYVEQIVTRDAALVEQRRDPVRLRRYLEALALNSAGVVDDTTLWQAARINRTTAIAYDALLQSLFVTSVLPAWTPNRLKRLVLSPKRYLIDAGLFAGVLGLTVDEVALDGDLLGRVLDTFVVSQLRAELALDVPTRRLSHLRLPQGRHEIDVVIELGPRKVVAIEIKATASPRLEDAKHLMWLREELGAGVVATVLFHTGPRALRFEDGTLALPISVLWS